MGEDLDMDQCYSTLLVKQKNVDDFYRFTIEPISLSVKRLLRRQVMTVEKKERLQTYLRSPRFHDLRIISDIVFESLAQLQLQEEVALNLVPMVEVSAPRSSGNAKQKTQFSSPADVANPPVWIQFKLTDTVEFDVDSSNSTVFQAGVFYVPTSSNELAFDSFILIDQVLYIFQFTIAALHEINEGMTKSLSRPTLEAKLQGVEWRFVFVIPSGSTICPESNVAKLKESCDRATLFTAEIDIYQAGQPRGSDGDPNHNAPNHPNHPRHRKTTSSSSQSGDNVSPPHQQGDIFQGPPTQSP